MKIYHGRCSAGTRSVTVDGQPLKMKRHPHDVRIAPFAWGEPSVGAERVAYSMLADCLGEGYSVMLAVAFMNDVICNLDAEWEITADDIEAWREFRSQIGYPVQTAARAIRGFAPAEPAQIPSDWPRLVGNPNYRINENRPS